MHWFGSCFASSVNNVSSKCLPCMAGTLCFLSHSDKLCIEDQWLGSVQQSLTIRAATWILWDSNLSKNKVSYLSNTQDTMEITQSSLSAKIWNQNKANDTAFWYGILMIKNYCATHIAIKTLLKFNFTTAFQIFLTVFLSNLFVCLFSAIYPPDS